MSNWLEQQKSPFTAQGQSQNPAYTPAGSKEGLGWAEGFAKSALWGLGPDMVGVKPTGDLLEWREENPWSSFGSQAIGMAIPYAGWASATARIPQMARAVNAVASAPRIAQSPFAAGAAREVVRFAPLEAARIAGNFFGGDTVAEWTGGRNAGVGAAAIEGGLNLALGGAIGGAIPSLASMVGNKIQARGITPGADTAAPFQVQMRQVIDSLNQGKVKPEFEGAAWAGVNKLRNRIVEEVPSAGQFVRGEDAAPFNDLFNPRNSGKFGSSRLDTLRDPKAASWMEQNLPQNWEAFAQYPRMLRPKNYSDSGKAESSRKALQDKIKTLGNGDNFSRWAYLPDEKKFVVGKNMGEDSWLIFKTDKPEIFLPKEARFSDAINRFDAKMFGEEILKPRGESGSTILDYGIKLDTEMPRVDTRGMSSSAAKGTFGSAAAKAAATFENKSFSLGDARYEIGAAVQGLGEVKRRTGAFIKDYLAPSSFQFAENPLALRIHRVTQKMVDQGEYLAQKAILGNPLRAESRSMQYRDNALGSRFTGNNSIADRIRRLGETDSAGYRALVKTIQSEEGLEYGLRNGLTQEGAEILTQLQKVDAELAQSIIAAQRAAGIPEGDLFQPRANHFMLSRSWQGQYRTPVYNSQGKLVYVAGGHTPKESADIARKVAAGESWSLGDTMHTRAMQDFDLLRRLADQDFDYLRAMQKARERSADVSTPRPGTFQKRENVEGYQSQYTPDELVAALVGHASRYRKYEAEMGYRALFGEQVSGMIKDAKSGAPDPVWPRLQDRLNAMFGVRGQVDIAVNKAVDASPIGQFLGGDSASRIVQALSKYTYLTALGFSNFGYAVATLGTFMQTSLPMMKYINTLAIQAPERLHKYVSYQPLIDSTGQGATILGSIDAMKIGTQAMKEMGKPDDILHRNLYRAAAEGKTDPKFLDEYVGQNSSGVARFREILKGKHPISGTLEAIGSALPSTTERMSRTHSFTMGHVFYRDIMGVKDPDTLYRLAAEFTDLTQFQYGRSHKPMVFDGPLGQMAGLFKTFVSNYIGWMSVYAGEGIKQNNWAPLLWQMGGTAALGGAGALPLIGVANSLGKAFSEDEAGILESLRGAMGGKDSEWGNYYSNIIYFGLPSIIGATIQGTVQAPFANPVEDSLRLLSSAQLDQAIKMGKGIGAGLDALFNPGVMETGNTARALANGFAPRSMIRSAQALLDSDLRSMNTGNTLIKDLSPTERMLWGLGLNPSETSAAFTVFRDRMKGQEGKRKAIVEYGERAANAILSRDSIALRSVVVEAGLNGVPAQTLVQSARTRVIQDKDDMFQSHFDRLTQARMYQLGLLR